MFRVCEVFFRRHVGEQLVGANLFPGIQEFAARIHFRKQSDRLNDGAGIGLHVIDLSMSRQSAARPFLARLASRPNAFA